MASNIHTIRVCMTMEKQMYSFIVLEEMHELSCENRTSRPLAFFRLASNGRF